MRRQERCIDAFEALPEQDHVEITRIWLLRAASRERKVWYPIVDFICGSGNRLIVLCPWRKERRLCLGRRKPCCKASKEYQRFGGALFRERGLSHVEFIPEDGALRQRGHCELIRYTETRAHLLLNLDHALGIAARNPRLDRSLLQLKTSTLRPGESVPSGV